MRTSYLELTNEFYDPLLMEAWKNGDRSFLKKSNASAYIKAILERKAQKRKSKRFFGEALISTRTVMIEGWYSSFKWLTQPKWLLGYGLEPEFEKPFHEALLNNFGRNVVAELQKKANLFQDVHKRKSLAPTSAEVLGKPVPPDLWIITPKGRHDFIETKLPGDTVRLTQLAGLAIIKKYIGRRKNVRITIISLYPEGCSPKDNSLILEEFAHFYELA